MYTYTNQLCLVQNFPLLYIGIVFSCKKCTILYYTGKTFILLVWLLPSLCSGIKLQTRKINFFFPGYTIYYCEREVWCPSKATVTTTWVKLMFFPCHIRFFFTCGSEYEFFAPHRAIKSTLWPSSRKIIFLIS